ncbi:hypothetical protein GW17_00002024 [Ensete ventricosum]|nr:hypothetical protein GW17_00002024 [Ensete ventricosum]
MKMSSDERIASMRGDAGTNAIARDAKRLVSVHLQRPPLMDDWIEGRGSMDGMDLRTKDDRSRSSHFHRAVLVTPPICAFAPVSSPLSYSQGEEQGSIIFDLRPSTDLARSLTVNHTRKTSATGSSLRHESGVVSAPILKLVFALIPAIELLSFESQTYPPFGHGSGA